MGSFFLFCLVKRKKDKPPSKPYDHPSIFGKTAIIWCPKIEKPRRMGELRNPLVFLVFGEYVS